MGVGEQNEGRTQQLLCSCGKHGAGEMGIHALDLSIFCTLQPKQRSHGQDPQGKDYETAVAEELRAE